jgi:predicted enzyme related to lactoylglutathione lyase
MKGKFHMSNSANDRRIDYIEFPTKDVEATKKFYNQVFGWEFQDYGPGYTSFHDGRLGGGFWTEATVQKGGVLVVLYASNLEATEAKVVAAGGTITKAIFSFPGGRRFHFADPSGNELAVWSE